MMQSTWGSPVENLQPDCSLTAHHEGIVVWRDIDFPGTFGLPAGEGLGRVAIRSVKPDRGTQALEHSDFQRRSGLGKVDDAIDSQPFHAESRGHAVVTRRSRDHTGSFLIIVQNQQSIQRPPDFEGSGVLKVFQLQKYPATGFASKIYGRFQGGLPDIGANARFRGQTQPVNIKHRRCP
jgi:hypothetical protein